MRTTIDIPEPLLRRAKATAAMRGMKLKDLITSFVEIGLSATDVPHEKVGHARPLPSLNLTSSAVPSLSGVQMEKILIDLDVEALEKG